MFGPARINHPATNPYVSVIEADDSDVDLDVWSALQRLCLSPSPAQASGASATEEPYAIYAQTPSDAHAQVANHAAMRALSYPRQEVADSFDTRTTQVVTLSQQNISAETLEHLSYTQMVNFVSSNRSSKALNDFPLFTTIGGQIVNATNSRILLKMTYVPTKCYAFRQSSDLSSCVCFYSSKEEGIKEFKYTVYRKEGCIYLKNEDEGDLIELANLIHTFKRRQYEPFPMALLQVPGFVQSFKNECTSMSGFGDMSMPILLPRARIANVMSALREMAHKPQAPKQIMFKEMADFLTTNLSGTELVDIPLIIPMGKEKLIDDKNKYFMHMNGVPPCCYAFRPCQEGDHLVLMKKNDSGDIKESRYNIYLKDNKVYLLETDSTSKRVLYVSRLSTYIRGLKKEGYTPFSMQLLG